MFEELTLRPIREVMGDSAPIMDKDLPLSTVLERVEKNKTDRALLTEEKSLRGILTYRDVIFKLGTVRTKQATPTGMHASSFMNFPVAAVSEGEPLLQALRVMDDLGVTSVPAVSGEEPVGIVSRWELASLLRELPQAADITVRDVMKTFPLSAGLYTRILHVRQLLFQHDLSVVPVMEEERFLGVIGVDEILEVFLKYYELARGEPKRVTPLKYVIVSSAVKLRPPRVEPDSSVAEAADKMLSYRYRVVVVIDNEKPVGYISGLELARLLIRGGLSPPKYNR